MGAPANAGGRASPSHVDAVVMASAARRGDVYTSDFRELTRLQRYFRAVRGAGRFESTRRGTVAGCDGVLFVDALSHPGSIQFNVNAGSAPSARTGCRSDSRHL
jgi:hypothetical protein